MAQSHYRKKNYHPVIESEKVTLENQHTKLKASMDLTNWSKNWI